MSTRRTLASGDEFTLYVNLFEDGEGECPVRTDDSLRSHPRTRFDIVLTKEDAADLDDLDVIAAEIVEDLRTALAEFELIQEDLSGK